MTHNELSRVILSGRDICEDILFFHSFEDVRYRLTCEVQSVIESDGDYTAIHDPQLVDVYVVQKYLMEMHLPLKNTKNEFAIRYL
jgi:hypothetical protein